MKTKNQLFSIYDMQVKSFVLNYDSLVIASLLFIRSYTCTFVPKPEMVKISSNKW